MNLNNFSDVIIIGAGITSLSCALVIANAGYNVRIIGISDKTKGGIQLATNSFSLVKCFQAHTTTTQPDRPDGGRPNV